MDDMTAFERQIGDELRDEIGPLPRFDATEIVRTTTTSPRWRFGSMFNATKFVLAGAIVALVGGFLLSGVLTQQRSDVPAAEAPALAVAVSGTSDLGTSWDPANFFEGEGYSAMTFVLDGLSVDFDDDRLDGSMEGTVEMVFYEPEIAVIGGPISITNDGGGWNGEWRGAGVTADDTAVLILLDGSGAYAGLSATLIPSSDGSGDLTGVIYAPEALDPSQRPKAVAATE